MCLLIFNSLEFLISEPTLCLNGNTGFAKRKLILELSVLKPKLLSVPCEPCASLSPQKQQKSLISRVGKAWHNISGRGLQASPKQSLRYQRLWREGGSESSIREHSHSPRRVSGFVEPQHTISGVKGHRFVPYDGYHPVST